MSATYGPSFWSQKREWWYPLPYVSTLGEVVAVLSFGGIVITVVYNMYATPTLSTNSLYAQIHTYDPLHIRWQPWCLPPSAGAFKKAELLLLSLPRSHPVPSSGDPRRCNVLQYQYRRRMSVIRPLLDLSPFVLLCLGTGLVAMRAPSLCSNHLPYVIGYDPSTSLHLKAFQCPLAILCTEIGRAHV